MKTAYGLNTAWMMSCAAESRAFERSAKRIAKTQERLLLSNLRRNAHTWYGRQFRFASIRSAKEYQQRVPLQTYEALCAPIERIASGETAVLTRRPIQLLEPTGGSTSAEKLVPYTRQLKREFQRALSVWVFDAMQQLPAVRQGRAYWSISPLSQGPRRSTGGIPIGFDDDRDYLAGWQRWAVSRLLVAPPQLRQLRSWDNARYVTLLCLLASPDLSLISVWSPTFLTSLLSALPSCWENIIRDISSGQVRLPNPSSEARPPEFMIRRDSRRADQLRGYFANAADLTQSLAVCWPQLSMLSCWADASSANYAAQLRLAFPGVTLQPKGLLATEGVVSIPLIGGTGSALAVRSHFLEFLPLGSGEEPNRNEVRLADELELHQRYRVILTTGGGLYRYELGDEIEVVDYFHACPRVRFLGRGQRVSDLVGEKLNEAHVRRAIETVCGELGIESRFAMLAPTSDAVARYRLFIETVRQHPSNELRQFEQRLEELLQENPQYGVAIRARQLCPAQVSVVPRGAWAIDEDIRVERGQQIGDIKPTSLDAWRGWDEAFGFSDSS